jgi:hypothetical protein
MIVDEAEAVAAQQVYDATQHEVDRISGDLSRLRRKLDEMTAYPVGTGEPVSMSVDPGAAFVETMLSGGDQAGEKAEAAAEKAWKESERQRQAVAVADEKTRRILDALGEAINQHEAALHTALAERKKAGRVLNRITAIRLYNESFREHAIALCTAMAGFDELEKEHDGAGIAMQLHKFELGNPINDEWIDLGGCRL